MALIFLGQTICPICQDIIYSLAEVSGFPAFIPNVKDKLYIFNDEACHLACLQNHVWGKQVLQLSSEHQVQAKSKICVAGGNVITNPSDYIFLPLLTSDESEELFRFNFTTLDKNNLHHWKDRQVFIDVSKQFIEQDKWLNAGNENYHFLEMMIISMLV